MLIIALLVKQFFFSLVRVDGTSMYPNLQNNERVMMLRQAHIKHDTVIVFNAHGVDKNSPSVTEKTKYVKRVIGMPGDKIEYRNDGRVFVNGHEQSQSYITASQRREGTLMLSSSLPEATGVTLGSGKTFTVPKNKYFVLGDNRKNSNDSRYYGFVPKDKVEGVVKVTFWNDKSDVINSYGQKN
ncbi:signal peptidase I [Liquorilactobacillus sucicola DSM 21376 = JCM 15457]|nr:signal peptidase I [Liquorilactobacillus sucicola DSM 21376 = JCM 15457]